MANRNKRVHRKDREYYQRNSNTKVLFLSKSLGTESVDTNKYKAIAGEDLTGKAGEPAMLGTDGKIYLAEPHADNYNRVIGIITIENTAGNQVTIQTRGIYDNNNYNWTGDAGDMLVVRDTGLSESILTAVNGAEVMHIQIANIIDPNTIYIREPAEYYRYL